ncbi:MAG: sulfatase-like hydrolase/transferase, partial [Candidatus Binatia bacterium]
ILILTDDQGWWDIGTHGNPYIETPSMDRLASEGINYRRFYASPVCAPTRAALMTGRYYLRTGIYNTRFGGDTMQSTEITIAEILRNRGYRTALFGKWHLGHYRRFHPDQRGFDEFLGFTQGHIERYFYPDQLMNNGRRVRARGHVTNLFTDSAIGFVRANRARPFFLYLVLMTPHGPYNRYPPHYDRELFTEPLPGAERRLPFAKEISESEQGIPRAVRQGDHDTLGHYVDRYDRSVRHADAQLGRLFEAMEREGLLRNTIIAVTSDHGEALGDHGSVAHGVLLYEPLIRVPWILWDPQRLAAGRVWREPVSLADVAPTLLGLAGGARAPTFDGRDLSPDLRAGRESPAERYVSAVYLRREQFRRFAVRGRCLKLIRDALRDREELYDLCRDPAEKENLAATPLGAEAAAERERLRHEMRRLVAAYPVSTEEVSPAPIWPKLADELRALGYLGGARR